MPYLDTTQLLTSRLQLRLALIPPRNDGRRLVALLIQHCHHFLQFCLQFIVLTLLYHANEWAWVTVCAERHYLEFGNRVLIGCFLGLVRFKIAQVCVAFLRGIA